MDSEKVETVDDKLNKKKIRGLKDKLRAKKREEEQKIKEKQK